MTRGRRFLLAIAATVGTPLTPIGADLPLFLSTARIATAAAQGGDTTNSAPQPAALVRQYCVTCHNQRAKTAGLALDAVDFHDVARHADLLEKVVRKLRTGSMPPPGAPRPDPVAYDGLATWLERELDRVALANPDPGRPLLHRLNRTEYRNAIRDLLALDVGDVEALLPADDSSYGFDNIADVLGVSPSLLERYLDAASTISALAVGNPRIGAGSTTYRVRQDLSQDQHIDGLPFGTQGGLAITHRFPLNAEYEFSVKLYRTHQNMMRGLARAHDLEISVDGERVHLVTVGGPTDLQALYDDPPKTGDAIDARLRVRVPLRAGQRAVTVAFLEQPRILDTHRLRPFLKTADSREHLGLPHVYTVTITGPFKATGPGETDSRRRIFTCRPDALKAVTAPSETRCASEIVATLARRAYRQPVSRADLQRLMAFYADGRKKGGFEAGIEMALRRIIASPKFVFRMEADPPNAAAGTTYRISDLELASRLSFFLWSSIPDDELLAAALENRLHQPGTLAGQVRRMLADPKSEALVINFAGQWLQLRNLRNALPSSSVFPDFDDNLRHAFQRETELLLDSIIREDRSILDLLRADYTYVNERLARHYGIPNVSGSRFRRVPVPSDARRGLLGHGSILTVTSHAQTTSPVLRGKWILDNLLGIPPPPPPPNLPALEEPGPLAKPRTMRQQMEAHRTNPVCANCHRVMDSIGFAMENLDAVGAWRTRDGSEPVDASAQLMDGSALNGVVELREALLRRPDVIAGTMTEKLLTYALGRGITHADMPAIRAIVREAATHDYRFSTIVGSIVGSTPFQMRRVGE